MCICIYILSHIIYILYPHLIYFYYICNIEICDSCCPLYLETASWWWLSYMCTNGTTYNNLCIQELILWLPVCCCSLILMYLMYLIPVEFCMLSSYLPDQPLCCCWFPGVPVNVTFLASRLHCVTWLCPQPSVLVVFQNQLTLQTAAWICCYDALWAHTHFSRQGL